MIQKFTNCIAKWTTQLPNHSFCVPSPKITSQSLSSEGTGLEVPQKELVLWVYMLAEGSLTL